MPELRTIDADDDGVRLDRWFKRHYPSVTHVLLEKLLRKGEVRLDGKRAKAADRLTVGQSLRLPPQVIHDKVEERPKPAPVMKTDFTKRQPASTTSLMRFSVLVISRTLRRIRRKPPNNQ